MRVRMYTSQYIKERVCVCMSPRRVDDWNPIAHVLGSQENEKRALLNSALEVGNRDWAAIIKDTEKIQEVDGTVHQIGLSGGKCSIVRLLWGGFVTHTHTHTHTRNK